MISNDNTNQLINEEEINEQEDETIKIFFPEIKDVTKYIIKWEYLLFFRQALKKLHKQNVTFGELSLAKIKIIELEHIETKETIDLYFNLIDVFCDNDSCQSKEIWENCKINYTIIKKLSDFYEYDDVLQKYTQNTEIFSIFKTKKKIAVNNYKENIDFFDEKYDKYQDDFKEIDSKINNLVKYDEQTIMDIDNSVEQLEDYANVFKLSAADLHNKNIYARCKDILYYVFFFLWLSDCVTWVIQFLKLTERNPEFEETSLQNIRILLFNSEFNLESKDRLSQELSQFVIDKFQILEGTDMACNEVFDYSRNIINKVTNYVENGVPQDKWLSRFIHAREVIPLDGMVNSPYKRAPEKFLKIADEYDVEYSHISGKSFVYFNNYGLKAIKNEIEYFMNEYLNEDVMDIKLPDIYILSGFKVYPHIYEKDFYSKFNYTSSVCLDTANDLLKGNLWYLFFSTTCFISQIIGPIYYIIHYFIFSENEICPDRSEISTKIFATCYYLLLYAQFSKIWDEIVITCAQYDAIEITKHSNYIICSWVINNVCLLIIPFFTYTLFIEHNELTDLILNCLTGQFLIDIDNLAVTFSSSDFFLNKFIKDKMLVEYINNGINNENIMNENSILQTVFTILGVIQAYSTIVLSIVIAKCI